MWERWKQKGKKRTVRVLGMAMLLFLFGVRGLTVQADENHFVIEAEKLPNVDETYDIRLSVENLGGDWEGIVRLIVKEEYRSQAAYDIMISLPQGSEKQFIVKVPVDSMERTDGTIWVSLWEEGDKKVADKEFKYFLLGENETLNMGILSDAYSNLTYLDMGGELIYYFGKDYPVRLQELEQGSLTEKLDALDFLVIDTYNTGVLMDEEVQAIMTWVDDGGVMIVGTGNYGGDTLAGLADDLEVNYLGMEADNLNASHFYSDYVDLSLLPLAMVEDTYGNYDVQYCSSVKACAIGDGAVGVLPYALTELADMGEDFYRGMEAEEYVLQILEETSGYANARYSNYSYDGQNYEMLRRMLNLIGKFNSPLNLGVLKVIVIIYVIFVGPVLYLILRLLKKREWYWMSVPVTAVLGILLIFFAGRGFEVVNARVYSVTAEDLSGKKDSKSYLYCYDANHEEWSLKLKDGFEYAGALLNSNYNYNEDEDEYYYRMQKEGNELSFGVKPSSNFEDTYFYAGKSTSDSGVSGTIVGEDVYYDWNRMVGTVTNQTNCDFKYYAVISNDTIYVYEGLAAGETAKLEEQIPTYEPYQGYNIWSEYLYEFLYQVYYEEDVEKMTALSALGAGVCVAYPSVDNSKTVIVGVTEDWDKVVDDDCKEMSYGCLYVVE